MQSSVWFPEDPARKALVQRWAIAFVWCAMDHVREDCDLEPHLQVMPVSVAPLVCRCPKLLLLGAAKLHVSCSTCCFSCMRVFRTLLCSCH